MTTPHAVPPPPATNTATSSATTTPPPLSYPARSRDAVLWAGVLRDGTILAEAPAQATLPTDELQNLVSTLLAREPSLGWDTCSSSSGGGGGSTALSQPTSSSEYRGLRFPIYEVNDVDPTHLPPRIWTVACAYDPSRLPKRKAQAFVEKIVLISEYFRTTPEWQHGTAHSCTEDFAPILRQRMDEMNDKSAAIDESLDLSAQLTKLNRVILNAVRLSDVSHAELPEPTPSQPQKEDSRPSRGSISAGPMVPSTVPEAAPRPRHSSLRFVAKSLRGAVVPPEAAASVPAAAASAVTGSEPAGSSLERPSLQRSRTDSMEDFLQTLEREVCQQPPPPPTSTVEAGVATAPPTPQRGNGRGTPQSRAGRRPASENSGVRAETLALLVVAMLSCLLATLPKSILEKEFRILPGGGESGE